MSITYPLQSVLLPDDQICTSQGLFFRESTNQRAHCDSISHALYLRDYATVSFNTYFNAFSIRKWKQYTSLDNLQLRITYQGKGQLLFINDDLNNGVQSHHVIASFILDSTERTTQVFPFHAFEVRGIHSFVLQTEGQDLVFYEGCYETKVEQEPSKKKIAVNICTYHRERYVYRNFELISRYVQSHPNSSIGKDIDFFIVDNGETLDSDKLAFSDVHFIQQKDSGATGGFTRGLLAILDLQPKRQYAYALMMDDDVLFYPEILERTLRFVTLLKPEYDEYILAGSMLRFDNPTIQNESGGWVNENRYRCLKQFLNLEDLRALLFNDLDECADVSAWWYCVSPMKHINEQNLPFPYFFHREDMDYCHRLGGKVITLNGIGLWHEPFEYKEAAWHQYYNNRNLLIFNALNYPDYTGKKARKYFWKIMRSRVECYRYKECQFIYEAVEDFCKGPEWLLENDNAEKLEEKYAASYSAKPLDIAVDVADFARNATYCESKKRRVIRKLTLNGYLLPANHDAFVSSGLTLNFSAYRAKKLYNVNPRDQKYFITEKKYGLAVRALYLAFKACRMLERTYDKTAAAYRSQMPAMITRNYWEQKLGLVKRRTEA